MALHPLETRRIMSGGERGSQWDDREVMYVAF